MRTATPMASRISVADGYQVSPDPAAGRTRRRCASSLLPLPRPGGRNFHTENDRTGRLDTSLFFDENCDYALFLQIESVDARSGSPVRDRTGRGDSRPS